jgi:excisionase family DNA binding protein
MSTVMGQPRSIADIVEATGRLLTVRELSTILAMSKSTLYDRAKSGAIPSINTGGSDLRFDPFVIAAWLRERAA